MKNPEFRKKKICIKKQLYIIDSYIIHATQVVCVTSIHEWWDVEFSVDSEPQFKKRNVLIIFTVRFFDSKLMKERRRK